MRRMVVLFSCVLQIGDDRTRDRTLEHHRTHSLPSEDQSELPFSVECSIELSNFHSPNLHVNLRESCKFTCKLHRSIGDAVFDDKWNIAAFRVLKHA